MLGFSSRANWRNCCTARCWSIWYRLFIATLSFSWQKKPPSAHYDRGCESRYFLRINGHPPLERTKSRREKALFSDMRRPALLVLAAPHLHRFRISLDSSVFRIEMQCAVHLPCNIGKLQHRNRDVANSDRSVEFLALTDSSDEVREMSVGHRIAADQVSG